MNSILQQVHSCTAHRFRARLSIEGIPAPCSTIVMRATAHNRLLPPSRCRNIAIAAQSDDKIDPASFWADDEDNIGGNNNNNGGGDGPGDDGFNSDNGGEGFPGTVWSFLLFAAASLGLYGFYKKTRAARKPPSTLQHLDTDDVRTLKRLLREVFADLVKVRGRLNELEKATGVSSSDVAPDATLISRRDDTSFASSSVAKPSRGPSGPLRVSAVHGALKLGGGLLWSEGQTEPQMTNDDDADLTAVQSAGVLLGTDMVMQFDAAVRDGSDRIAAEVSVDSAEDNFLLHKVVYNCLLAPGVRAVLAPFGAKGSDVAYTLNPIAGQGLTSSVRHGNPMHQRVLGAAAGAALNMKRAWLSLAYFSQAAEEGRSDAAVFAQAAVAPFRFLSLGLTVLEPIPHTGSVYSTLSSSSPQGVASSEGIAATAPAGEAGSSGMMSGTHRDRRLGAMVALSTVGGLALHGWTTAAEDALVGRSFGDVEWGISMAPRPDGSGNGWLIGVGKVGALGPASDKAGSAVAGDVRALEPNMMELSTQFNLGEGLFLTPGVVLVRRTGAATVFAGVKTSWMF